MEDLRCYTVHFFYEVKDAELYGGKGTIGYAEMKYNKAINTDAFTAEGYIEHLNANAKILSQQLEVPIENITPICRDRYDEMTESEEDEEDYDMDYEVE